MAYQTCSKCHHDVKQHFYEAEYPDFGFCMIADCDCDCSTIPSDLADQ